MKSLSTVREVREEIKRLGLKPVGMVPTMGALHEGHLSLVRSAMSECPLVVVSIYVNPTQFNDKEDLKKYPRTLERDLELLAGVMRENDIVFNPPDSEIYPEHDTRIFDFGNLGNVMEGLKRPGHFNGVGQVVSRLFDIVKPDYAWFGQKDFQQLAIIKELVRQTGQKVKIIGNPIIREADGLAMSSRNRLLEPGIRKNAGIIYRMLKAVSDNISKMDIPELKSMVISQIENVNGFTVEYFEIADDSGLIPVNSKRMMDKNKRYFGCIAVKAGNIRLIDNIEIPLV
jgi:pantoate--beta-alanine ligase